MKKFSDYKMTRSTLEGKKVRIDDILDEPIVVLNYKIAESKRKRGTSYLTLQFQFKDDEEKKVLFTGSAVLQDQMEQIEEQGFEPFETTIIKIQDYYSLS